MRETTADHSVTTEVQCFRSGQMSHSGVCSGHYGSQPVIPCRTEECQESFSRWSVTTSSEAFITQPHLCLSLFPFFHPWWWSQREEMERKQSSASSKHWLPFTSWWYFILILINPIKTLSNCPFYDGKWEQQRARADNNRGSLRWWTVKEEPDGENSKMGGNNGKRKPRNVDKKDGKEEKVQGNMEQTEKCSNDKDTRLRERGGGENFILMKVPKSPCWVTFPLPPNTLIWIAFVSSPAFVYLHVWESFSNPGGLCAAVAGLNLSDQY